MFEPEKMLSAHIWLLDDDSNHIVRTLAREGSFHVVDQHTMPVVREMDTYAGHEELAEACIQQAQAAEILLRRMHADASEIDFEVRDFILSSDSNELLDRSHRALETLQDEIDTCFRRQEDMQARIDRLDAISEEMHLLNDYGVSFEDLAGFRYFYVAYGIVERETLNALRRRIQEWTHHLLTRPLRRYHVSVLLVGDREHAGAFEAALAETGFHHHDIPERFRRSFDEGLDLVEAELWALRDGLADLNRACVQGRPRWQALLSYWKTALEMHSMLLRTTAKFGTIGHMTAIAGFVPASQHGSLMACLQQRAPERYYATFRKPEDADGISVPTKLKNWRLFRPFELFVRTYGLPGYHDLDPTPFVALSFLAMFGMMFGDVGHGAVLAAIGAGMALLPYRIFLPMRALGYILFGAGLSGMAFGFLFGAVFGIEEDGFLPALWMRPSHQENLPTFLGASMGLGVGIISLGIVLNIVQSLRQGKRLKALVGQWSVSSLAFYWMLLGLLGWWGTGREVAMPTSALIAVLIAPLVLVVGGQAAHHLIVGRRAGAEFDAATVFFEPIEIIMGLFTNTISFLRVGAFGLAHAALTMATFVIKDMMPSRGADFLTMPIEHLFIIVLEGMIVTIQCLRLEYYEFFSKFFNGDGVAYAPLSIEQE